MGTDLLDYLGELSLAPASPVVSSMNRRALAAAEEWERDADWRPFLSTGAQEARTFHLDRDPTLPGGGWGGGPLRSDGSRTIDLKGGLLSLTSIVGGTTALTLGSDFALEAYSDPQGPAQAIRFLPRSSAAWNGPVVVTGVWGRVLTLPAGVVEAVLAKGALLFMSTLASLPGGALIMEKAGPVEYQYAKSETNSRTRMLQSAYDDALASYRFVGAA